MKLKLATLKRASISSLPLLGFSLLCVLAIMATHHHNRDAIVKNKARAALAIISDVVSITYDNDLLTDQITLVVPNNINPTGQLTVYRARQNNQPVGLSLIPVVTQGYNGNISLVIGLRYDGQIMGINILEHKETEGFGDKAHQTKSDWLRRFTDNDLTTAKQWTIKKGSPSLDQLSGATITANSINRIVYETLEYYQKNRDRFYE